MYHTEAGEVYHRRRLLRRRGRVFYYRQRVPQALVPLLGRVEVMRSLRTADPHEARRRAAVIEVGLGRRWAALLAKREQEMGLDEHELEQLAQQYFERLVAEDRAGRATWRPSGQVPDGCPDALDPAEYDLQMTVCTYWGELEDENERMLHGDRRSVKEDVEQAAAGRALDEETRERLAFAFQRARMRYLRAMAQEWEEDFAGRPRAGVTRRAADESSASTTACSSSNAKRITEAVKDWMHAEGVKWARKTQDETRRDLARFVQVVGDVPLDRVKREHVTRFKANLERVPPGTPATADITVYAGAEVPQRGLDRATVTKSLGRVSRLFSWAVEQQWIERSPAVGVLKGKKRGREAQGLRESFTREELARIFCAEYAELERRRPARFWVPILALYTGARLNELAQLVVDDVREEDGMLVLDLNEDGDEKSLKTEASRRKVPVHTQVIELGFREFVETRGRSGERRLFPGVSNGPNGFGGPLSTWFGRWRREHGVTSKKKTLHSMRHTVRDALSRAKVQPHVVNAVQGWQDEGMAFGQYGSAAGLDERREAVERLDWRGPLAALFERQRR